MKRRIVLLGAPGAGKGTLAKALSGELNLPHISSGDLFRNNIAAKTPIGLEAKGYIDRGQLVPDLVTTRMVTERIACLGSGFILDGYPRNLSQAQTLTIILRELAYPLDLVLNLQVPDDLVVERLSQRRICQACGSPYNLVTKPSRQEGKCDLCGGDLTHRQDDYPETVKARLEVYHEITESMIDYYRDLGLLYDLPAAESSDHVLAKALKALA